MAAAAAAGRPRRAAQAAVAGRRRPGAHHPASRSACMNAVIGRLPRVPAARRSIERRAAHVRLWQRQRRLLACSRSVSCQKLDAVLRVTRGTAADPASQRRTLPGRHSLPSPSLFRHPVSPLPRLPGRTKGQPRPPRDGCAAPGPGRRRRRRRRSRRRQARAAQGRVLQVRCAAAVRGLGRGCNPLSEELRAWPCAGTPAVCSDHGCVLGPAA